MEIHLSPIEEAQIAKLAVSAGFQSVREFVAQHLLAMADQQTSHEMTALNSDQLASSLAICDRGIQEASSGEGRDASTVLEEIAQRQFLDQPL